MIVCVPVTDEGTIDPRWGRADRVAITEVNAGSILDWQEHEVRWGTLHDEGTEGSHHARVARFLIDQRVDVVVAHHVGDGMATMLGRMGVQMQLGATGDAREAAVAVDPGTI